MTFCPSPANQALIQDASLAARARHRPLISRVRFQLGGTLVTGVLVPLLLRWPVAALRLEVINDPWQANSVIAAVVAIVVGFLIVRQFIVYPGARGTTYILPSLAISFGGVMLVMFLARLGYSRYMLVSSYLLSNVWLYGVFFLRARYARSNLALVPDGNHRGVTGLAGANWQMLRSPSDSLADAEAVVADLHADHPRQWERFIAKCVLAGIPVYDVKNVIESLTGRVDIERLAESSFGSVLPSRLYLGIKRALDLLTAALLLPIFGVVIALAALCIRIESPGPAFFMQPRMGYRGNIFSIFKLRSMRADHTGGQQFTSDGDKRVTRVGRVLRKYRIDEFPQIVNVMLGDMSWIGPRPEAISLADWYANEIPFYIYRHAVRPGISGWAQINLGNVAQVEAATIKLQYDFFYIKNFSPWLDLLITAKTIKTILTGFGSR